MIVLGIIAAFAAMPFGIWLGWTAHRRYLARRKRSLPFLVNLDA
ncbi:MAG TPA: hypothetical protein VFZ38_10665 [Vicinamibacterales bacterium]